MQRKVPNRVQRIYCQLTGPAISGRLKVLNQVSVAALFSRQACAYRILRTIPLTCLT